MGPATTGGRGRRDPHPGLPEQPAHLSVEARVSESGVISFPLIGVIRIGGMSPSDVERLIARRLREGNFLQNPQVTAQRHPVPQSAGLGAGQRHEARALPARDHRHAALGTAVDGRRRDAGLCHEVILTTMRDGRMQRQEIDLVEALHRRGSVARRAARGGRRHLREPGGAVLRVRAGAASGHVCARSRHDCRAGDRQGRWPDAARHRQGGPRASPLRQSHRAGARAETRRPDQARRPIFVRESVF